MRNPTVDELAPLYAILRDIANLRRKHAAELAPLVTDAETETARIAELCKVPPGPILDELDRRWLHPQTRKPITDDG